MIILKSICYFIHPWAVYYVFYFRNRMLLKYTTEATDRNIDIFYDYRSELI